MNSPNGSSVPDGPLSVTGAPNLPERLADTFTSRYVDAGALRLHAVIGGDGPPLLLVHGWPETWYAWRIVMPALARESRSLPSTSAASGCPTSLKTATTRAPSHAT